MNERHLWTAIVALTLAIGLSIWDGILLYNNLEIAKTNPEEFNAGYFEIYFFFLTLGAFFLYVLTTMQLRLYKNRPKWLGWLGVLGPLGAILVLLVRKKIPREELQEEEEEPAEPPEETLEVETIRVRTADGRIMHLKTSSVELEEIEGAEPGEATEPGEENEKKEDTTATESSQSDAADASAPKDQDPPETQSSRQYGLGGKKRKKGGKQSQTPDDNAENE